MKHWKTFALAGLILMAIIGIGYPMIGATRVNAQSGGPNTGPAAAIPNGPIAPLGWFGHAVVNPDGTLARGARAVTVARIAPGAYEVIFNENIRHCTYIGTIGISGFTGISAPGLIAVAGANDNVNGVYVTTSNSTGAQTDRGFHLLVSC